MESLKEVLSHPFLFSHTFLDPFCKFHPLPLEIFLPMSLDLSVTIISMTMVTDKPFFPSQTLP